MKNTLIATGIALMLLFTVLLSTCTKVGPKTAGFRVNNAGNYRGVANIPLCTGYQFYVPWVQHIETVPTTMEHIVWSDDKKEGEPDDQSISISCLGGAGFFLNVGLNVHVIASEAPRMWIRWNEVDVKDIMKKFLRNVIRGDMQIISSSMTVDSVLNNYSGLESACRHIVTDSLRTYGFAVDGFNFLGRPRAIDAQLEAAIARKIAAKQESETKTQELQSSIAEANKKIATARGDSASSVIEATGKAEAIKALQQQVTPTYVDYLRAQNWDGRLPTTMLSSGSNTLFSLK